MAKIPKFSDLTAGMPGMLDKVKSMFDHLAGPGSASATEEALEKETDPFKAQLLEVELLINQISDMQLMTGKTLHLLKAKYADLKQSIEPLLAKPGEATKTSDEAADEKKENL